jgi:hypothetical protein
MEARFMRSLIVFLLILNHLIVYAENKTITNQEIKSDFFKAGIIQKANERFGVYITEENDSVWVISIKYAKYLKGDNYTKKDVGNISYWINKVNYSRYPGGVKNRLKIGEKVLIPIDKINKALKLE